MHELGSHVIPSLDRLQEPWRGGLGGSRAPVVAASLHFHPRAGLRDRHRGHHCKEGSEETAAVQDLPVVPGQRVPRDEDVLGHHRLRSGKEPAPRGFIQSQTESETRESQRKSGKEPLSLPRGCCGRPVDERPVSGAACEAALLS